MKFEEALKAMKSGILVKLPSWAGLHPRQICLLKTGFLQSNCAGATEGR